MESKITGVYCIENINNGKKYIGIARDIQSRWKKHIYKLSKNNHSNSYLQSVYNNEGLDILKFYVIQELPDEEEILKNMETYWICYFNSYAPENGGYNLTRGGDGCWGREYSDETKQKLSKALIERDVPMYMLPKSQETIKKLSESKMGKNNPFFGKKHSQKTIDIIINKNQGSKSRKNSWSKYVGVSFKKSKWRSYITVNKRMIELGSFSLEEDAALAYNDAAIKFYGENAKLNIINNVGDYNVSLI